MKIAKELLRKTEMTVKDIALEVGYSNFSHFSKTFKKSTNMNPKDFRQYKQVQA
jgi:two-component system response regulator YesN